MKLKYLQKSTKMRATNALFFPDQKEILDENFELPPNVTLGTLEYMFDVAKRMLGLANKLQDPNEKAQHLKRIMVILNKIRAGIRRKIREYNSEATETRVD